MAGSLFGGSVVRCSKCDYGNRTKGWGSEQGLIRRWRGLGKVGGG
jgi:hypothetical protein